MLNKVKVLNALGLLCLWQCFYAFREMVLGPEDDVKELLLVNALLPRSVILALGARHVETVSNVSL